MIPKDQGGGGTPNQKVNRELPSLIVQNKVVQINLCTPEADSCTA